MTRLTATAVIRQLFADGIPATYEYPGFINVRQNETGTLFHWGDANPLLSADVYEVPFELNNPTRHIESAIPSDSTDHQAIADEIRRHLAEEVNRQR